MTRPGFGWAGLVLAAFLPVLAACTGPGGGPSSSPTETPPVATATATVTPPRPEPAGGVSPLVLEPGDDRGPALAAHLAERLGVDASTVQVVSIERQVWPDGCLGLVEPGRVCSQALVDGWLAILRGPDGSEYRYRGTNTYFVAE